MQIRTIYTPQRAPASIHSSSPKRKSQNGKLILGVFVVIVLAILFTHFKPGSAVAASADIRSGLSDYCLDVHNSDTKPGTIVDNYKCNNTQAQAWMVTYDTIQHENTMCLSVLGNSKATGSKVVINPCTQDPGQIWLRDQNGFENPNSGLCLALPSSKGTTPVTISTCTLPSQVVEKWTPAPSATEFNGCHQATKGERIACTATEQWDTWQSEPNNHEALLTAYTGGAPYEEWCADFVSYIYKQAGYPFTQGGYEGWDESNANKIQDQGFTMHNPADYTPQPGDVAYFDYEGGHVEVVVSGGKHPTFVYGNSGTIDPTTGNGEMEANTITQDGSLGNLVYYLSPN